VGPFGLALGYNSGSAFSLFAGTGLLLALVAVVIVGLLVWLAPRAPSTAWAGAIGLVLGGALGNLADRALRGHRGAVVDFVTLTHWPTFNVADTAITAGALLLAVLLLRRPAPRRARRGDR
jgi:signal peptidase II